MEESRFQLEFGWKEFIVFNFFLGFGFGQPNRISFKTGSTQKILNPKKKIEEKDTREKKIKTINSFQPNSS